LLVFFIVDFFVWILFSQIVAKSDYEAHKKFYARKPIWERKKFETVEEFTYGKWHTYRFIVGLLFLISIVVLSQIDWLNLPIGSGDKNFDIAFLVFVYIVVIEMWTWYYRLKRKFGLLVLTEIIDSENENASV
jgi:hypothetical protein